MRQDMLGRGVGKTLLAELIRRCEALDYRQMIAVIGDSANAASIGLHASLGFLRVGTLRSSGYKLGRWGSTACSCNAPWEPGTEHRPPTFNQEI